MAIRIGIIGYGNLAKGVESEIRKNPDMKLCGIFTRRDPAQVTTKTPDVPVYHSDKIPEMKDDFDCMIICGGSATDLPKMTKEYAKYFNVIDSFDTHANIPEHFAAVNESALGANKVAVISCGWDPGMFSLNRLYANAILTDGEDYTFWGKGVSQGHSDAIRRVPGVKNGKQYTIPIKEALDAVRSGSAPELTARDKHLRECFVVPEEGADLARIEKEICEMPNYFADYNTIVHFIDEEEFARDHSKMNHGGFVIRTGRTGFDNENKHVIEYSLKLDSNPEFTASVLLCYARAAVRLEQKGDFGCKTVFDIAPALLSPLSGDELRAHLL
ncbi:MAG: diaminopimelate dehydrogenase [Clostridiales bacterium]|nr:diaminopimelate dehydrogenase [Clostridiales bacterium]